MTAGRAEPLRIVTRGSALALTQTHWVAERLAPLLGGREIELLPVTTQGDARRDLPLTELGEGVFVKALEAELIEGHAELAVHSLKDVPSAETPGLTLAAIPTRADPRDALITRDGQPFEGLAQGAMLGTGSPRRVAQIRAMRPDLQFVGVRGNVETRLRRLDDREIDGLIMAVAGLARLGLEHRIATIFRPEDCVPAVGQGALAVQCRSDDDETLEILRRLDDPSARLETTVERAFLASLGGGCQVPIGALARRLSEEIEFQVVVADSTGMSLVRHLERGSIDYPEVLAARTVASLNRAAGHLLDSARAHP